MMYKAIFYKKEKRKEYRGAKAIDCTCRNHGSCPWCKENRLHKFIISKLRKSDSKEDDYEMDI